MQKKNITENDTNVKKNKKTQKMREKQTIWDLHLHAVVIAIAIVIPILFVDIQLLLLLHAVVIAIAIVIPILFGFSTKIKTIEMQKKNITGNDTNVKKNKKTQKTEN